MSYFKLRKTWLWLWLLLYNLLFVKSMVKLVRFWRLNFILIISLFINWMVILIFINTLVVDHRGKCSRRIILTLWRGQGQNARFQIVCQSPSIRGPKLSPLRIQNQSPLKKYHGNAGIAAEDPDGDQWQPPFRHKLQRGDGKDQKRYSWSPWRTCTPCELQHYQLHRYFIFFFFPRKWNLRQSNVYKMYLRPKISYNMHQSHNIIPYFLFLVCAGWFLY